MTISLHVVADNCPQDRLDRALLYLQRVRPPTVDVAAGAELTKGMQFVERIRRDAPGVKVFWRNLDPEDTGIHTKMSAAAVYARKVKPYLQWFKDNEIVFMPDNESGGDDEHIKKVYVPFLVEILVLLHTDKLNGAVLRSSTGTFPEHQYSLFKPVFSAMLPGDYVSPNEYSPSPGYAKGGGGHLERYKNLWKAAGRELPTVIGEAGIAMNYDPGKGYIDAGMSDQAMAQQLLDEEIWYKDGEIDRHVYLMGGFTHAGYRLRDGVLDYWEKHYAKRPPVIITPKPPFVPIPANLSGAVEVTIGNAVAYPLQATPTTDVHAYVGLLQVNERVTLYRSSFTTADALTWYWCERVSTPIGQSAYGWIAYKMPIPDTPTPPTTDTALQRMIKALDEIAEHEAAIVVLNAEIKRLANLHRALADAA